MSSLIGIIEQSMMHDLNKVTVSSHNMSNVSTTGFKRDVTGKNSFDVYMKMDNYYHVPKIVITNNNDIDKHTDFASSSVKVTNNPLNVSLRGNGFFVINTSQGEVYTRNGDFRLDSQGRLVTQDGNVVAGINGEIRLTTSSPRISHDGVIWEGNNRVGKLAIVNFKPDSLTQLSRQTNGMYSTKTTKPIVDDTAEVIQGYLEGSNVDGAYEMINTVETLRHFELNQKLLHMQQEMLKTSFDALGDY